MSLMISGERASVTHTIDKQRVRRILQYTVEDVSGGYCVYGMLYQQNVDADFCDQVISPHSALSAKGTSKEVLSIWMGAYVRQKAAELTALYRSRGER